MTNTPGLSGKQVKVQSAPFMDACVQVAEQVLLNILIVAPISESWVLVTDASLYASVLVAFYSKSFAKDKPKKRSVHLRSQ